MILFIDDSVDMGPFIRVIIEKGYSVDWAGNFDDAIDSLEFDPGANKYSAIILDLAMSNEGLPDSKEVLKLAEEVYSGWAFYVYVLKEYPLLQKNTIILSGVPEGFMKKIGENEYSKLNVVKKGYGDIDKVIELLVKFRVYK